MLSVIGLRVLLLILIIVTEWLHIFTPLAGFPVVSSKHPATEKGFYLNELRAFLTNKLWRVSSWQQWESSASTASCIHSIKCMPASDRCNTGSLCDINLCYECKLRQFDGSLDSVTSVVSWRSTFINFGNEQFPTVTCLHFLMMEIKHINAYMWVKQSLMS